MKPKHIVVILTVAGALLAFASCSFMKVKYSFTGASIPDAARTVSIPFFPNNAPTVSPILSSTLTEALQDKFARQTRLQLIPEGGDLAFDGEIIGYAISPSAISGAEEQSMRNKLTITVRVSFTNIYEPQWSFTSRTFSAFSEYDTSQDFLSAEPALIEEIVTTLVDEIFNAAVANW